LLAGGLLVASAANLQFNVVGTAGITREEMVAVVAAAIAIVVAKFANVEHEIPELGTSTYNRTPDEETTRTRQHFSTNTEVNPTTASIITSILGEQQATSEGEVASAITTLSSGTFGESVINTMNEVQAANEQNNKREAQPTDEETGQTLQRVLVQPVPLPGQEDRPLVDPASIPGLTPNREFVRDGVASVPLPGANEVASSSTVEPVEEKAVPDTLLSSLPDLPDLLDESAESPAPEAVASLPALELPDLDELFADEHSSNQQDEFQPTGPNIGVPELPDLDDLF
jgi:hypothetical protein